MGSAQGVKETENKGGKEERIKVKEEGIKNRKLKG